MIAISDVATFITQTRADPGRKLSPEETAAVRAEFPAWLGRWAQRPYVDDEFIAEVAMNFGDREPTGVDTDIAEWLRSQQETAAVEAGAAFLGGYWKSARAVDAGSVRIVMDEADRRSSIASVRALLYAALASAVRKEGRLDAPVLAQAVKLLRAEARSLKDAGQLQGLYQVIRYA